MCSISTYKWVEETGTSTIESLFLFHFTVFIGQLLNSGASQVFNLIKALTRCFLTSPFFSLSFCLPHSFFLSIFLSLCLFDRAVATVLQGGCPGEQLRGEEALGMHSQHYASRATNLREFPCSLNCSRDFAGETQCCSCGLEQPVEFWVGSMSSTKAADEKKREMKTVKGPYVQLDCICPSSFC